MIGKSNTEARLEQVKEKSTSCCKDNRLDLYWKLEPLRKLANKWCIKRDVYNKDDPNYFERVAWSFACGYSLMDAIFYELNTPQFVKRLIRKLKCKIYF